jgi:hypothetical protein
MRRRLALAPLLIALAWARQAQEQKLRIYLTASSNVAAAPIGKSLDKHCPEVVVSVDKQRANYLLEAIDTGAGKARKPYKFTLVSPDGDRAFCTETAGLDSAVKDVCAYIWKREISASRDGALSQ